MAALTKSSPKVSARATGEASAAKSKVVTGLLKREDTATLMEARRAQWKGVRRAHNGGDCVMPMEANQPRPSGVPCRAA
ncbi:unnamed protein product [Phytophthora lilii]|uniref:Unnamed protein product n=1 Tax=Phytophthora lilii TaxID=2077276 RepID=A0A9W6U9U2_9STRA|nr:unnamed protein product [Phytophthora lilii]